LVAVSAIIAMMLVVFATPASAQGGCKAFGQSVAEDAKVPDPLGQQFVRGHAPLNDGVTFEFGEFCG
jgi:hypothetical protein